ncbi:hypothetical protein QBC40DRAFT_90113 [Triangularia verruculosa]|uniref:Uncharacterized protein n=1 Tax=Triangularia verruculosa TaxID=2587418 RepID=A0AAN6XHF8_9PEZI|nr:hypothetical protein QBC40DRAFT_90113 [Triangularia verruculosa]
MRHGSCQPKSVTVSDPKRQPIGAPHGWARLDSTRLDSPGSCSSKLSGSQAGFTLHLTACPVAGCQKPRPCPRGSGMCRRVPSTKHQDDKPRHDGISMEAFSSMKMEPPCSEQPEPDFKAPGPGFDLVISVPSYRPPKSSAGKAFTVRTPSLSGFAKTSQSLPGPCGLVSRCRASIHGPRIPPTPLARLGLVCRDLRASRTGTTSTLGHYEPSFLASNAREVQDFAM